MITQETRKELFERAEWLCEVCGQPLIMGQPQLAHRLPKTVSNLDKYGEDLIDDPLNLVVVDALRCNDSVLVKSGAQEAALVAAIKEGEQRWASISAGGSLRPGRASSERLSAWA